VLEDDRRGFGYKDKSLSNDGLFKILLKQGTTPGKAKILVLGKAPTC